MKIGIIVGSHRKKSQSTKVSKYIEHLLKDVETYTLDLRLNPLPFWDEGMWEENSKIKDKWAPYSKELASCDGFVVISPEWGGMVPAGLKNVFLLCGNNELAHKPAMIVSVSAGRGGSYPITELRMSSYKNTHLLYIPDHVIVQHVEKVLNNFEIQEDDKADAYVKKRLTYSVGVLREYTKALEKVRKSNAIDLETYPYGM